MRRALAFAWLQALVACGSDVSLSIRSSFGTIDDSPRCSGSGGSFSLEEDGGLVVVVILDEDSDIFDDDGSPIDCDALSEGASVRVRGRDDGDRLRADQVELF